ncbi:DUF1996 domain-containing protein [Amycolatopsis anabasis]|uniref:DUF1996 domain-containing protein n=1 Tax=Amycolatopsis anabasis TaxID=1840409 RepID=UPI00131EC3CF|nr:DUF1996 domain-containing protein [Amycolatopsis anabasis]
MARNQGRHRVSRRTKLATGALGLTIAVGAVAIATTTGDPGRASADAVDKSFFVDITKVQPNVKEPRLSGRASRGTFTVDCGKNENGHFNPDNFIAQPGVRNGAEHLHDYVGNLSTNAVSNNRSLLAAGTTCKNGDQSAYFWPVLRIDQEEEEEEQGEGSSGENKQKREAQRDQDKQAAEVPRVECPDVATALADVPDEAMPEVDGQLAELDQQQAEADKQLAANPGTNEDAVLNPLRDKRSASINRIADAVGRSGERPDMDDLAACAMRNKNSKGIDNGDENSEGVGQLPRLPEQDDANELPGNDGEIQRPETVELTFRGSPAGPVRAMPKFLRVLYGDAKVSTNGPKNAKAGFTCTGFEDRLIDKYPICPEGSKVKRVHDFPSCWDGKNIDSKNHRDHIVFPNANGQCKSGFTAVPQLRISLTYDIPREVQLAGQYKVDSFPEEDHNPASEHDDFANVMSQQIMNRLVNCINRGRTCQE